MAGGASKVRLLFEKFLIDKSYYEPLIYHIEATINYFKRSKKYNSELNKPILTYLKVVKQFTAKIYKNESKAAIKR